MSEWLRNQIAFAIWNDTNPPPIRAVLTPANIGNGCSVSSAIGNGYIMQQNFTQDWEFNKGSFLKLSDVAIAAFEAADEDGSAYREIAQKESAP
jgi:hypothetical protein